MILLDTQAVFWLAQVPEMLSDAAREAIRGARGKGGCAISDKTLWELACMIERKRVHVKTSMRDFLVTVEKYFIVLPVTSAIAERAVQFSKHYPKDPADRIIGATAVVYGIALITSDESIRASGEVTCIW